MTPSALRTRLEAFQAPGLVGLVLFGSAGRALKAGEPQLAGCRDLDILVVTEAARRDVGDALGAWLAPAALPLEVFVISRRDFISRLTVGDAQLISILATGVVVSSSEDLLAWKRRADRAQLRSDVSEVQRLLAEADRIVRAPAATGRDLRAALIAACQAILLTLGVQPLGTRDLRVVIAALAEQGHAPPALEAVWPVDAHGERRAATREWIGAACACAFRNLARLHWGRRPDVTAPPKAILFDLGGVLFLGRADALRAHALPVLERLAASFALVAVSNAPAAARRLMEVRGLSDHFDDVVLSAEVGRFKPEPEMFALALGRSGLRPDEAIMVGDRLDADICGAWRCGLRAVWLRPGNRAARCVHAAGAVATDLRQLPRLLA